MFANFVVIVIWILTHRPGREPKLRKKPLPDCIPTGGIFILVQGERLILAQGGNFNWRTGATRAGFYRHKEQAEQEFSSVKADIRKEKLKNSATDVDATLLDGVGSLFGSSRSKQQQQQIETLETDNRNLSDNIKNLNTQIKAMETEHKTAIDKLTEQLNKIFNYFPHIKELLRWEGFLKTIGLPDDMVQRLFNKETVIGSGELYSKEYSKQFKVENASLKLEQDRAKPENIRFTINGHDTIEWFRMKYNELQQLLLFSKDNREDKQLSNRNKRFKM